MYKSYISTHLYNWVCADQHNFKINDANLEQAVIIDAARLVRYLIDRGVCQTTTTLLKQPDHGVPLKFQKASTLATTGYGLFSEGMNGYSEADMYVVDQYTTFFHGSQAPITKTKQTTNMREVPAEEIMLQIAARYGSPRTQSIIFRSVTHGPRIKSSIVAGAEAACLYYSNLSLLKMLYAMFPNFLHVELAGFCRSRVLLEYKLSTQSDRIGDWQIGRITGLIAQRDDLDIMKALETLLPDRNVADLAAVRGAAENAPKILAHYIGNEFDRLVMYATQNPGASLDWMWQTDQVKLKEHLGRMFAVGLGGLKYKLILWCTGDRNEFDRARSITGRPRRRGRDSSLV